MEEFIKGDIVVVPFPFSDLVNAKKRPALVLTNPLDDDLILCLITTKSKFDKFVIDITDKEVECGELKVDSYIRPNKIFTANKSIIAYKLGRLNDNKKLEVNEKLKELFYD